MYTTINDPNSYSSNSSVIMSLTTTLFIVLAFIVALLSQIAWIVIGSKFQDAACMSAETSVTLASWLVVLGSSGLGCLALVLTVGVLLLICGVASAVFDCAVQFLGHLLRIFFSGWSIYGIVLLTNDDACHQDTTVLTNTVILAVVLTLGCTGGSRQ